MATLEGLQPEFRERLQALLDEAGPRLRLNYGFRTTAEQQRLYDLYLAGKGAPANRPGTSAHEKGLAADVDDLGKYTQLRADLAKKYGFYQPYPKEPWHLQLAAGRTPLPVQGIVPAQEEDDMIQYEWEDGAILNVDAEGHAFCPELPGRPTAKHFGGMPDLKDSAKQAFDGRVVSAVGVNKADSQAGYVMLDSSWGQNGEIYKFDPSVEPFLK